jgi:hypothetical protein
MSTFSAPAFPPPNNTIQKIDSKLANIVWLIETGYGILFEISLSKIMSQDYTLEVEAPQVTALLSSYWHLHEERQIRDCDIVALFILTYFSLRRSKRWASGLSKLPLGGVSDDLLAIVPSMRLVDLDSDLISLLDLNYIAKKFKHKSTEITLSLRLVDVFNWLTFSGVKHNSDHYINKFVVKWYMGERPVKLLHYIPTPYEVLTQQSNGERVVTMFKTVEELSRSHTSKLTYMSGMKEHSRDPLEFLLHDIRHMEHFINADSHEEQVGFFHCLFQINGGKLKKYFLDELGYPKTLWFELEYVISDMNCFSIHLLRYLHAKWFAACQLKSLETGEQDMSSRVKIEWEAISNQLFTVTDLDMQDLHTAVVAYQLNDISMHVIQDLPDHDWHLIRDWFVAVGRKKLSFLRGN